MKNVTVNLTLERASKKTGLAPIYVCVMIDGKKKYFHTGQKIPTNKNLWNKKKLCVKVTASYPESRNIFAVTESKKNQIQDVINKLEIAQRPITFEAIEDGLKGGAHVPFVAYVEELIEKELSTGKIKQGTATRHHNALAHARRFDPEILLVDLTSKFMYNLQDHILEEGVAASTTATYMKIFARYINKAKKVGDISTDPLAKFERVKFNYGEREFLTIEELQKLNEFYHSGIAADHEPKHARKDWFETMQISLRAFLFGCYSGLRVSDIMTLEWSHLKERYIQKKMVKTGGIVKVPYNSGIGRLVDLNADKDAEAHVFECLPSSSTVQNRLDFAMKFLEIKKEVSFHCSRHTFATAALSSGVDLYTVSKWLGHKDIETTKIYARLIDEKLISEMDKFDRSVEFGMSGKNQASVPVIPGRFRRVG